MSRSASLLPEFDQEMKLTRAMLERVPVERADWRPHEKSYTLGALAVHLTELPTWAVLTIRQSELDLATAAAPDRTLTSSAQLLDRFDARVADARAALMAASDEAYDMPWTLRMGEKKLMTMPRGAILRSMVLSHMIHHRGQLTVYLRMLDVPLPSIYGRTADDPGPFA